MRRTKAANSATIVRKSSMPNVFASGASRRNDTIEIALGAIWVENLPGNGCQHFLQPTISGLLRAALHKEVSHAQRVASSGVEIRSRQQVLARKRGLCLCGLRLGDRRHVRLWLREVPRAVTVAKAATS